MSLYNSLFGTNDKASILLMSINVLPNEIARFRDCYIDGGNVVIYTRTGGGNRECYSDNDDHSECYHTYNDKLAEKSNYVHDYDDSFDCTYAYFVFKPLSEYQELISAMENPDELKPMEKFHKLIESMKGSI